MSPGSRIETLSIQQDCFGNTADVHHGYWTNEIFESIPKPDLYQVKRERCKILR